MISGYAKAASALNNEGYKKRAIEAANFIKKYLYTDKKRLLRSCYTENNKIAQMSVNNNLFVVYIIKTFSFLFF